MKFCQSVVARSPRRYAGQFGWAMRLLFSLILGLCILSADSHAAGELGELDREPSWRDHGNTSFFLGGTDGGPSHFGSLPDAQELDELLSREVAQDPEDLYRLGLAYENEELWEPDYERAFAYFQRSEALGFPWAKSQLGYYYETGLAGETDLAKAVDFYQQGADFGDSWSGLRLGYLYLNGRGLRQHDGQAFFWIQWASRGGVVEATSALGWLYENGRGTSKNPHKAKRLYEEAAGAGSLNALVNLGLMHERGVLGTPDAAMAVEFYRKAADEGSGRGRHHLGTMSYLGKGVEKDQERAVSLFREAIGLQYPYAHVSLGLAFEHGGGVEQDYAKAALHYQKAIDAGGYPRAKAFLAWLYQTGNGVDRDLERARDLFEEAAGEGQTFALTELGYALVHGINGVEQDIHRGRRMLERAANDDYGGAILVLAEMYDEGDGVARDTTEALRLFHRGIDLGGTDALLLLGDYYADGEVVEQSFEKAKELYLQALEEGNEAALVDLGYLYTRTDWSDHDFQKAMQYFLQADEAGLDNAPTYLGLAHFHGEWADEDDVLAREYFQRATENGYYVAAEYLGYMDEEGLGGPVDREMAVRSYEFADEGGKIYAAQRLLEGYGDNGWLDPDPEKAFHWMVRAGELGDAEAAYAAAEVLSSDPAHLDLEKASDLFRIAADDGNLDATVKWARMQILGKVDGADFFASLDELKSIAASAPLSAIGPLSQLISTSATDREDPSHAAVRELFLGLAYANGIIFPADQDKAEAHLRRSIEISTTPLPAAHLAFAEFLIDTAVDTPQTHAEILRHLENAATGGHFTAQMGLGELYASGHLKGQPVADQNAAIALKWFRRAAEQSDEGRYWLASTLLRGLDPSVDPTEGKSVLEDLAVLGDDRAAFELGLFHSSNEASDDYDPQKALAWFEKSARFGNIEALDAIGWLHRNRMIENHSLETAFSYQVRAAEAGLAKSAETVAWHLRHGKGVKKDLDAAERWYLKSKDLGNRRADFVLSLLYLDNAEHFGEQKLKFAVDVFQGSDNRDNAYAWMALGRAFVEGLGVEKDAQRGLAYYRKALEQVPMPANTALGNFFMLGHGGTVDYELAHRHYSKAADLGSAVSLNNLGWMFQNGLFVDRDYARAISLYNAAIEAGDTYALTALGLLYRDGEGVEQDYQEAIRLFREALDRGFSSGKANVGWMLLHGLGVEQDRLTGLELLKAAVAQNDTDGTYYMAVLLEEGKFLNADLERAKGLYKIAAEQGNLLAAKALERLGET